MRWLAFTDTARHGAAEMIQDLRDLGVEHIAMLTGDNEGVAERVADESPRVSDHDHAH